MLKFVNNFYIKYILCIFVASKYILNMYIQHNKSVNKKTGKEYKSVILCSKYREGGKVKTRAIANLSHLPAHVILSIENTLKSEREATIALKDIEVSDCIDFGKSRFGM